MKTNVKTKYFFRNYTASLTPLSYADAYTFCSGILYQCQQLHRLAREVIAYNPSDLGLGLAIWKGEEPYQDVSYISANSNLDLFTALNNEKLKDCSNGDCSGRLVCTCRTYTTTLFYPKFSHDRLGNKMLMDLGKDFHMVNIMEGKLMVICNTILRV